MQKKDNKYGFIDINNNTIIPFEYEKVDNFNNGLAAVKKNGKWGYINRTNDVIIDIKYDTAYSFQTKLAAVKEKESWFFINTRGKKRFKFENNHKYASFFSNGLRLYKDIKTNKIGFKNHKNKIVIAAKYDEGFPFINNLSRVELNGLSGYINKKGRIIIPIKHKDIWDEREGLIRFLE